MSGFESPNYTQVPNDFFDMIGDMGHAEIKVVAAVLRQTFGFHRGAFRMSITDMEKSTGLSRQAVQDGAESAEGRGVLLREQDGGVTLWRVNVGAPTVLPASIVDGETVLPASIVPPSAILASSTPSNKEKDIKEKDIKQTSAPGAQGGSSPFSGKALTARQETLKVLEEFFSAESNIPLPPRGTATQKRSAGFMWWTPLWAIYSEHCGYDLDKTKNIVRVSIFRLRERGLDIASPGSILKTAISLAANGNGKTGTRSSVKVMAPHWETDEEVEAEYVRLNGARPSHKNTGIIP